MDDALRTRILAEASRILMAEGPEGLSNRKLAQAADTTTMSIYSRFGGKGGVLEALYLEGAETLKAAQATVAAPGPLEEVVALCRVFRRTALEHAGHYQVLFGRIPGWRPSEAARGAMMPTFLRLVAAVSGAVAADLLNGDARDIAAGLFAACHGHVMLELSGYGGLTDDPDEAYDRMVRRVIGAG